MTYFAPEARAAFEAAGLRGFWRGYFAGRAAPLGAVDAPVVIAAFGNFAPSFVRRALPAVWDLITPAGALRAREAGAVAAIGAVLGAGPAGPDAGAGLEAAAGAAAGGAAGLEAAGLAAAGRAAAGLEVAAEAAGLEAAGLEAAGLEVAGLEVAADLLAEAAQDLDLAGRPLGAPNGALPVPGEPVARLWHAATVLREHRGDGHVAALVAAGIDGCEALVLRTAVDQKGGDRALGPTVGRSQFQAVRGWTDAEWDAAAGRLRDRGWLDEEFGATEAGLAAHRAVEDATDLAAARPWVRLGAARTAELAAALTPVSLACAALLPYPNPVGLSRPAEATGAGQ